MRDLTGKEFSVIIQGKIFGQPGDAYAKQLTLQCIDSIQKHLPGAEIIISTWQGSDASHLPADNVIFNQDPGATAYHIHDPAFFNNNNRQILSTYNGLKAATRKYAIKMRGDCRLSGTRFLNYLKVYPRSEKYSFFKQRVVIPTMFSRNPRRIPQLIHPSDVFQVGLTVDLLDLWDIPLQPEPETTRAFPLEKRIINNSLENSFYRMKFGSEQYIWYAFTKKHGLDMELKHFGNIPSSKIVGSDWSIINNFVIVEPEKLDVVLPKRFINYPFKDLYTHNEWLGLSRKYANGVTKWFKWMLIAKVHLTNILLIARRAFDKLIKHGPSKFFKVQKEPYTTGLSPTESSINTCNMNDHILKDISVVIQGKVFGQPNEPAEKQQTQQCINSIRQFIPDAEIIISTWQGSDVTHITGYDKVIFNDDPGAVAYFDHDPGFLNNNNRQITSTYNGLMAATRTYAIKMRGDCLITSTDFLDYMQDYPRGDKFRYFKQRVLIPTKYTRNPRRIALLIHPSDIFQLGLTQDLRSLWDIPLQPEPQTTRAFPLEKKILNSALIGGFYRMKFGAEQYIWYAFCKKMGLEMELKHYSHIPVSHILNAEMSMINNFIIAEAKDFGVALPERMYWVMDEDLYTHAEWLELSRKYAGKPVSKLYEWGLISRVYANNITKILARAQNKLFTSGPFGFVGALNRYVAGPLIKQYNT